MHVSAMKKIKLIVYSIVWFVCFHNNETKVNLISNHIDHQSMLYMHLGPFQSIILKQGRFTIPNVSLSHSHAWKINISKRTYTHYGYYDLTNVHNYILPRNLWSPSLENVNSQLSHFCRLKGQS